MTIDELADTGEFQGLFQATFEEALTRRFSKFVDMYFVGPALFSFTASDGNQCRATFRGQVETFSDTSGETTGTLQLRLQNPLTPEARTDSLQNANLTVQIETFPGL